MGIIEQAARRLEELRQSGIVLPQPTPMPKATADDHGLRNLPALAASRVESSAVSARQSANQADVRGAVAPPEQDHEPRRSELVEIDLDRLSAMGFLTPQTSRSQIADEFRVIKRPLLANVNGKSDTPVNDANLIMVTSSVPDEGKTFVAINLAISMAMEMDKKVLLVDADMARPSVMESLGIDRSVGFLDVLADPTLDMSSLLLRTNIDGLTVLPAGAPRARATEMLASEAMNGLLAGMASRYADRIIVFDSPPLLPSTEARVLATYMGQIVFVVEAERTSQKTVLQALATIESCPVVMPLLNKTSHSEVGSYYGYYGPTGS
ncbi:MAG: XrtA-associated tyrosine autokinase [Caldimonas sp.]